jgi:ubiquinone/menaquinone biosynthesis C-methylase UbiE
MINLKFLRLLACPLCKSSLKLGTNNLKCVNCNQEFLIVGNIPILVAKTSKHVEIQAKIFNKEFKTYDKYELENWRISYIRRLFEWLELSPGDNYLDIGVGGSGYTVIEASRKNVFSVGIDISFEGIKKAKYFAENELKNSKLCNFAVANAEYLPFKSKTFSKVSAISVLEHIPNDELVIKEIARIIKPNGKVFISVPNMYKRINPIFWMPYYIHDKKVGHLRHYKAEDLIEKFSKQGFNIEGVFYTGHFPKMLQIFLSLIHPKLKNKDSKLWWKFEEMDLKRSSKKSGLQLTLIFKKVY